MRKSIKVLIIDDLEDDALLEIQELKYAGYAPEYKRVETKEQIIKAFSDFKWDVILCDFNMPTLNGLDVLNLYKDSGLDIPFIISSGTIGDDMAVDIIKKGAHDYVLKSNLKRLSGSIESELREYELRKKCKESILSKSDPNLAVEVKKWTVEQIMKLEKENKDLRKTIEELKNQVSITARK